MVKRYQSVLLGGSICPGIIPIRVDQLAQEYFTKQVDQVPPEYFLGWVNLARNISVFFKIPLTLMGGSTSAGIPGSR
jgi:hypothetical protein